MNITVSRFETRRAALDYADLCLVIEDLAHIRKNKIENYEEISDKKIIAIEKDIDALFGYKNMWGRAGLRDLYKINWDAEKFKSPLEKIKQGKTDEAIVELQFMYVKIHKKLSRFCV